MQSELTSFPYRIDSIKTEGQEPLIEEANNAIEQLVKDMNVDKYMHVDFEKETAIELSFDDIQVSTIVLTLSPLHEI